MIRPIIAIVGRPNVGKSTLFNRLVGRRQSLVRDVPGVTRDRLYGTVTFERWQATVVDTGGFEPKATDDLLSAMREQIMHAIDEADLIVFTVDGREGLTPVDTEIAGILRRSGRPVVVAANKVDGAAQEAALGDVYRLGFKTVMPVSAEHGRGVAEMLEAVRDAAPEPVAEPGIDGVRVAIVGRPNVGKSSLVNAVLGQPRVLVHSAPGTTRDSVDTPLTFRGHPYVLIDTAGIRRKGKVSEALEKLSVVMALKSLERCQVAVLVLDASEGVTAQDAHIAGYAHDAGRALVIAVNKWDLVPPGMVSRGDVTGQIQDRLPFLDYAPICFISALRSAGLPELFDTVKRVAAEAQRRIAPGDLLALFREALERRPASARGMPLRIQGALQVAVSPPTFALRVNLPDDIHFSYERYLVNSLRHVHPFSGSPIRLLFRKSGKSGAKPGPRRSQGSSRR
jgi:GTP-binding protein